MLPELCFTRSVPGLSRAQSWFGYSWTESSTKLLSEFNHLGRLALLTQINLVDQLKLVSRRGSLRKLTMVNTVPLNIAEYQPTHLRGKRGLCYECKRCDGDKCIYLHTGCENGLRGADDVG